MATTTFSGPIKAGTIKNTIGTTVGSDMKNTGQVVMAQTHAIDLSGGVITAEATAMIIPANSQIDRKSVVQGKSVDLGGRRIIKKKKQRQRGARWNTYIDN